MHTLFFKNTYKSIGMRQNLFNFGNNGSLKMQNIQFLLLQFINIYIHCLTKEKKVYVSMLLFEEYVCKDLKLPPKLGVLWPTFLYILYNGQFHSILVN